MSSNKLHIMQHIRNVNRAPATAVSVGAASRLRGGSDFEEVFPMEEEFNTVDMIDSQDENIEVTTVHSDPRGGNLEFLGTLGNDEVERPADVLIVDTGFDDDQNDPLPQSNRFSTLGSSRGDLLSARSNLTASSSGSVLDSTTYVRSKFCIFEFPSNEVLFEELCKKKIASGATVCVKKNCTINHRGGEAANVEPGDIMVQKNHEVVFAEPKTNARNISAEVLSTWFIERNYIEDWIVAFSLANSTDFTDEPLSSVDLLAGTKFTDHAMLHKSPDTMRIRRFEKNTDTYAALVNLGDMNFREGVPLVARKRTYSEEELDDQLSKGSRRKLSEDVSVTITESEKLEKIKGQVDHLYKLLVFLTERLDIKDAGFTEEVKILFARIEMMYTDLGTRPTGRTDRFQVPTIWGSIAVLSGTFDDMHKDIDLIPTSSEMKQFILVEFQRIEKEAQSTVNAIILDMQSKVGSMVQKNTASNQKCKQSFTTVYKQMYDTQESNEEMLLGLAQGASKLKKQIDEVNRIALHSNFSTRSSSAVGSSNCSNYVPIPTFQIKMDSVDGAMGLMQDQLNALAAETDGDAIKSFGLGFRDRRASEAWIDANMHPKRFGLVVDVHLVFEHLYDMVAPNEGVLKVLNNIQKLDLENLTQGLCITSFETRLPKILSKASMVMPSRSVKGVSHFDRSETYAAWDEPVCGTREVIEFHLNTFAITHQDDIDSNTEEGSRGRELATKSLQASVLWIHKFMSYIDETYKGFMRQHTFTDSKAWELTTQLGKRICVEVSAPRTGLLTQIRIKDILTIHKLVFWPILRSLDVMKSYQDANFRDHPTIAGEYVKFLTANSGSEIIHKVSTKVDSLTAELVAANKALKDATASAMKAMNIADEFKRKFFDFEKRLTKAEQGNKRP